MAGNELVIRVAGKDKYVPVASFLSVVHNTIGILREVDAEISDSHRGSLKWRIKDVSQNSPITMTIFAEPTSEVDISQNVVDAYTDGLQLIDESSDAIPPFFTPRALEKAKRLVGVLNDGVERIAFEGSSQKPVTPTQRLAANVDELLHTYDELTSFEGNLDAATVHGKRIFYVWDVFDGRVSCRFPEHMLQEVLSLFGHRVIVHGRAHYSRSGKPLYIEVEDVEGVPEQESRPAPEELEPINITDGLSSEEYIRRLRDADDF